MTFTPSTSLKLLISPAYISVGDPSGGLPEITTVSPLTILERMSDLSSSTVSLSYWGPLPLISVVTPFSPVIFIFVLVLPVGYLTLITSAPIASSIRRSLSPSSPQIPMQITESWPITLSVLDTFMPFPPGSVLSA